MSETCVKVAVRVRTLTAKEQISSATDCISVLGSDQLVLGSTRAFSYDHVFATSSAQIDIYTAAVKPLIDKFIEGYNATVLAYGQASPRWCLTA